MTEENKTTEEELEDLVILKDKSAVTTSLQVAKTFKKEHKKVLRDIENLLVKDRSKIGPMFIKSHGVDTYGRPRKIYYLQRDGFTLLAMGFTGSRALEFKLKYIAAFNLMEEKIKEEARTPGTFSEALFLAAKSQKEIEEMRPKVEVYDNLIDTSNCLTVTQIADNYKDLSAIKLNRLLCDQKIQYKKGNSYHLYQGYKEKGLAVNRSYIKDNTHVNLVWTIKGQYDIYFILKERYHILPINKEFKESMEKVSKLLVGKVENGH